MSLQLIWGCNPVQQFEQAWVELLLEPSLHCRDGTVLVESGLLRLERSPSPQRLYQLNQARKQRISELEGRPLTVIHLSDEEGLDADDFYPQLPDTCKIWRNFSHPRLMIDHRVRSFPIGPRDLFLVKDEQMAGITASNRPQPWAFMGTLWSSGSRTIAVSHFLRSLPQVSFMVEKFWYRLALEHYRQQLMQSVFALAPEGDRHPHL